MAERRRSAPRHNPYRPGSESYARTRGAELRRGITLDRINAARAKTPETRRRARRAVSSAQQALRALEAREQYRSRLAEQERKDFSLLPIREQQRVVAAELRF